MLTDNSWRPVYLHWVKAYFHWDICTEKQSRLLHHDKADLTITADNPNS